MKSDNETLIEKYVVPYLMDLDRRKAILKELSVVNNRNEIITLLLQQDGWRNKYFAAICIGVFEIDDLIDDLFQFAIHLDEMNSAKAYAFALIKIKNKKTKEYLIRLATKDVNESEYKTSIQNIYKSALSVSENRNENCEPLINFLERTIEFWKTEKY